MATRRLFLILLSCLFSICALQAKGPTTTWPYIFENFAPATIYLTSGGKIEYTANIHLAHSYLHYIDGENIREAKLKDILIVEIGGKRFMNVNNSLMEIVQQTDEGFVAMLQEPDYTKLNETGGAYGGSSNTLSTRTLTSIEGFGSVTNHMMQMANKENGKILPLKKSYYLVANGRVYPANKSSLKDFLPLDRQEKYKAFIKKNKIKWGDPADLIKLIEIII